MKKIISSFIAIMLCLSMVACGQTSGRADEALVGKYISVSGTALGITLTGDDIAGFNLELKSKGKAVFEVDGTSSNGKWVNDDSTVTVTVDGVDMVGTIGEDTITFESILEEMVGTSMDLKLAREGSDAARPENNLPDEERVLLGDWVGVTVTDALDEDASGDIAADAMQATFNGDHTASIKLNGEEIATPTWSVYSGTVFFEGDVAAGASLYGEMKDENLVITYSGEDYYDFTMEASN